MSLGLACLDAAERPPIARDRNLSTDRYAERIELGVIFDQAVVDVHNLARDVALTAVSVDGRILRKCRRWIVRHSRLGEGQSQSVGSHTPDTHLSGVGHPDVIATDFRL